MSRLSTAYASAYQRDRVHVSRIMRGESRTLSVNFNAVLGTDTIASVTWRAETGYPLVMSAPAIVGSVASVNVLASNNGAAILRCTVTLASGATLVQLFRVEVEGAPYFSGEVIAPVSGPTTVTA